MGKVQTTSHLELNRFDANQQPLTSLAARPASAASAGDVLPEVL